MAKLSMRHRLLLVTLAALLILGLGGYTLWWYRLAGSWRDGIVAWVAAHNSEGLHIATGGVTVGGYPGPFRLLLARPSVTYPDAFTWQGPPVTVVISPFAPNHPRLVAPGQHVVALGAHPPLAIAATTAEADLIVDADGLDRASFDFAEMTVGAGRLGRLAGSIRRLSRGPATYSTPSLAVSASLQRLDLPDDPRLVLGPSVASARIEARVLGSLPRAPSRPAVEGWRDGGGTVEIDALAVDWPPLGVTGKGTLALDGDMQPILASSCTIRGLMQAIDGLAHGAAIRPRDAAMAKLVLGLLAKPGVDGVEEWTVPVTLQERTLYVGPAALLKVPALAW